MSPINPLTLAHQLQYSLRPNAHLFVRPDWRRYVQPGSELAAYYESIEQKYRPDQSRVPAGSREGGQWTNEGGQGSASPIGADDPVASERPSRTQFIANERSVSSERLIQLGGEDLGSFGDGVSVAKGPNISYQESFDPETGVTTLSFTGMGAVVVDEKLATKCMGQSIL